MEAVGGIPFQRSIMRLEEDLVRGIVGPDQSRNRYGLVLKPGGLEKDDYLTYRVRHYLLSTLAGRRHHRRRGTARLTRKDAF